MISISSKVFVALGMASGAMAFLSKGGHFRPPTFDCELIVNSAVREVNDSTVTTITTARNSNFDALSELKLKTVGKVIKITEGHDAAEKSLTGYVVTGGKNRDGSVLSKSRIAHLLTRRSFQPACFNGVIFIYSQPDVSFLETHCPSFMKFLDNPADALKACCQNFSKFLSRNSTSRSSDSEYLQTLEKPDTKIQIVTSCHRPGEMSSGDSAFMRHRALLESTQSKTSRVAESTGDAQGKVDPRAHTKFDY